MLGVVDFVRQVIVLREIFLKINNPHLVAESETDHSQDTFLFDVQINTRDCIQLLMFVCMLKLQFSVLSRFFK